MNVEEFEIFLKVSINAKGKSLDKLKKFFKEPDEKKLKKKLYMLLQTL